METLTPAPRPQAAATLLLVDDDEAEVELLLFVLTELGYSVHHARSVEEGWAAFGTHAPDAVIARHRRSEVNGLALARKVKRASPATPVILMVADPRARELRTACDIALPLPMPPIVLLDALDRLGLGP